ncbi:MAG: enoyl-CoA hydratase [Ramlibacter sp.]|nr:enoyl-CoA hydratase [Ramlibacter sp.]
MTHLEIADGIARLTLASPPVNALSAQLLDSLEQALESLEHRDDWSVLVLASTASVFCAGGDLQTMAGWMKGEDPGGVLGAYAARVQRVGRRIEALPQVTIALCERTALGGGLELALACDLRIASSRARFGLPEVRLGLLPGAGGTQRLTRACGKGVAMRLILGAEVVDAATALDLGIVQWLFEADQFAARSEEVVARFAAAPREALLHSKACIQLAQEPQAGFTREVEGLSALARTETARTLVDAFLAGARASAARKP